MKNKIYATVLLSILKRLSKMSTNTIDDILVAAVEKALTNVDYGLQRKPTGPRTKKATKVAKTKKA